MSNNPTYLQDKLITDLKMSHYKEHLMVVKLLERAKPAIADRVYLEAFIRDRRNLHQQRDVLIEKMNDALSSQPGTTKQCRLVGIAGWIGSIIGLLGSFMLAFHNNYSGFGFIAFLLSNFAWFFYAIKTRTWSMLVMQVGYTASSLLGVVKWII